jgi:hypothetical protein
MFNASKFSTPTDRHAGFGAMTFWGGGHTHETDPTNKGWKAARPQKSSQLLLVGQPGVSGCATLSLRGDEVDVAVYCETPAFIRTSLAKGESTDAMYHQLPNISGIGLSVIQLITDERVSQLKGWAEVIA